jgi:hypothetical protein
MEKELAKRKMLRRKYKHFAAALAGVAIMAGTSLHGIPLAKAAAAANPSPSSPVTTQQTTSTNKDVTKPLEADTTATNPSATPDKSDHSDKNTAAAPDQRNQNKDDHYNRERYKHERWADRGQTLDQRIAWYNDSSDKIQIYNDTASAVDIVMASADGLGFDVNNDTFNLISQSGSQSIVRVVHNGTNYDITVDHLSNGNWLVSLVNQIP